MSILILQVGAGSLHDWCTLTWLPTIPPNRQKSMFSSSILHLNSIMTQRYFLIEKRLVDTLFKKNYILIHFFFITLCVITSFILICFSKFNQTMNTTAGEMKKSFRAWEKFSICDEEPLFLFTTCEITLHQGIILEGLGIHEVREETQHSNPILELQNLQTKPYFAIPISNYRNQFSKPMSHSRAPIWNSFLVPLSSLIVLSFSYPKPHKQNPFLIIKFIVFDVMSYK